MGLRRAHVSDSSPGERTAIPATMSNVEKRENPGARRSDREKVEMTTYFCSDPHAFHGNILKYCRRLAFMTPADREAFLALEAGGGDLRSLRISDESVDTMNRGLAANINARVGPNDVLWCLGDWIFGSGKNYAQNA